ncbi:Glutaminase [Citrobacter freundii]|uniref:glutaminase n=1 Tax=Citrobacter freundii TaxID=546 RepID=A0A7G2J0F7_CITFR|nr:Glutaminase [Citrobacter freundii]
MARAMDNSILETIVQQVRPLIGQGKVADYIPALASVDGSKLGIAICTVDGQHYQAGDAQERFFYSVDFKGAQPGRGNASLSGRGDLAACRQRSFWPSF